jgi:high-affinity iron transporter
MTGIGGGILGAVLLALAADSITPLADGMGQEIINATILFLAVIMLSWHLLWMRKHAIESTEKVKQVGQAVSNGDREPLILTLVIGLAILREGSEAVLFLYGLAAAGTDSAELLLGGSLGLLGGIVAGSILYLGIARIPVGKLFQVSGWLILLLTAGLASQAVSYLVQADLLPALGYGVWDSSFLVSEQSVAGHVLHILIGYVDHPMGIQVITYALTICLLVTAGYVMKRQPAKVARI